MKWRVHAMDWLAVLLLAAPFLYLAYVYPALPNSVPTHFDIDGNPDAFHEKSSLWRIFSIIGLISLGVYLLIRFLPQIDPKKWAKYSTAAYNKIALAVVVLQSTIAIIILHSAQHGSFEIGRALPVALGLFFAIMGNLMHNIKPNYFVGIRTPWTLESEETWRKTHQLAGKLWFAGGITIAVISLFLPMAGAAYVLIGGILALVLIPTVYSYRVFHSLQRDQTK